MGVSFEMMRSLIFAFLIFFALRNLLCWYWKMNKVCELLENQNEHLWDISKSLKKLVKQGNKDVDEEPVPAEWLVSQKNFGKPTVICPSCGKQYLAGVNKCSKCGWRPSV